MVSFARVVNSQGDLVTVIEKKIITQSNAQTLDQFIDTKGNIYWEISHSDEIDGIDLMNHLVAGVSKFYQIDGFKIMLGRTN